MDFDTLVKVTLYGATATAGTPPSVANLATLLDAAPDAVRAALTRLRAARVLFLAPDGLTIRMAPPFSGVPTQHRVTVDGVDYFANCAWDALGIPAALHRPGVVHSRCDQSLEPLELVVTDRGPEPSTWLFHCLVPAAKWWDDLVFT
jgi:hypothetical protein